VAHLKRLSEAGELDFAIQLESTLKLMDLPVWDAMQDFLPCHIGGNALMVAALQSRIQLDGADSTPTIWDVQGEFRSSVIFSAEEHGRPDIPGYFLIGKKLSRHDVRQVMRGREIEGLEHRDRLLKCSLFTLTNPPSLQLYGVRFPFKRKQHQELIGGSGNKSGLPHRWDTHCSWLCWSAWARRHCWNIEVSTKPGQRGVLVPASALGVAGLFRFREREGGKCSRSALLHYVGRLVPSPDSVEGTQRVLQTYRGLEEGNWFGLALRVHRPELTPSPLPKRPCRC